MGFSPSPTKDGHLLLGGSQECSTPGPLNAGRVEHDLKLSFVPARLGFFPVHSFPRALWSLHSKPGDSPALPPPWRSRDNDLSLWSLVCWELRSDAEPSNASRGRDARWREATAVATLTFLESTFGLGPTGRHCLVRGRAVLDERAAVAAAGNQSAGAQRGGSCFKTCVNLFTGVVADALGCSATAHSLPHFQQRPRLVFRHCDGFVVVSLAGRALPRKSLPCRFPNWAARGMCVKWAEVTGSCAFTSGR